MPERPAAVPPDQLLSGLPVEQQVGLLTGAAYWSTGAVDALGLAAITLSDGPAGVQGVGWDERDPSTCLPAPVSLAATWDEDLVRRVSALLAVEAREKGVGVVLAPTVNLQRSPFAGRHFEYLSEDPLLSGRIGTAFVRGVQDHGVGAAAKHYVANDAETSRTTVDVRVDERALREVYLAPFEAVVVEGGVWVVMAAYNRVDGRPMTENPLLAAPLRDEWGFDGVVVSDWYAVAGGREPAAVRAGLGLVMPGPAEAGREALLAALRAGRLPPDAVREAAWRLVVLAGRVGALAGAPPRPPAVVPEPDDVALLLREAAAAGMVLLHDRGGLLPLDGGSVGRVAVLGPHAASGWIGGGGSAAVAPRRAVSPLAGLVAALGDGRVAHAEGVRGVDRLDPLHPGLTTCPDCGEPGFAVRYADAAGRPVRTEHRRLGHLVWFGDDIVRGTTIELRTRLRADVPGEWQVGFAAAGELTLTIDGETALDTVIAPRTGFASSFLDPPERCVNRRLSAGETAEVVLRLRNFDPPQGFAALTLGVRRPRLPAEQELARAVDLARDADVCVVVVGTGPSVETEGRDRTTLTLPGGQDDLVRAVAAVNPRTVVVVNVGAPVLLPWRDRVAAVLVAWFPGQEFGSALADVLLGHAEPGGRLPCTWPDREEDVPVLSTRPVDGVLHYAEGVHVGHRAWLRAGVEPAYPFGHGLGRTEWAFLRLDAPSAVAAGDDAVVAVRVRNTGPRPGREVVQVYLSRAGSAIDRPVRWLAGFSAVRAEPGADAVAEVRLAARAFQHWSTADGGWVTESGRFHLHVGRSVGDLRLTAPLHVR